MKKKSVKKSQKKKINDRKFMIYTIVILAICGLVFSSLIAAFSPNLFANNTDTSLTAQIEDQIKQYENSLKESPDDVELLTLLGNSYYQLGVAYTNEGNQEKSVEGFTKALEPYGKVLEKKPEDVNVRVDRAVAAFYSNNNEIADAEFKKAIELDGEHPMARYNYGIFLYYGLDKPEEAIEQWEKLKELNPEGQTDLLTQAEAMIQLVKADMKNRAGNGQFLPGGTNDSE